VAIRRQRSGQSLSQVRLRGAQFATYKRPSSIPA